MVQNDKITMIGKSDVMLMVDDHPLNLSKEDLVNHLKSISADDIQSIEVITAPPAKYEAQGNSGIINIKYKKGIKNAWNNAFRTSYTQATYPMYALGNTFSYQKGKIRLSVSADAQTGNETVIQKSNIFYPTETWIGKTNGKNKEDRLSGRLSFDYKLTDKISIGLQYLGSFSKPDARDTNVDNLYRPQDYLQSYIISKGRADIKRNHHSVNLHYIQELDSAGRKFSVDLDYFTYKRGQNRFFTSERFKANDIIEDFFSARNASDQDIENYSVKIDFEHPTKWADITYGSKASYVKNYSKNEYFNTTSGASTKDPLLSDGFLYKENTQALYLDATKNLGEKWKTKIGWRLESTQTKGISESYRQTNKTDYLKLFPTFYLLYTIKQDNSLRLSYNRRIERPSFSDINPFRWHFNKFSYAEGNPFLRPSFSDNIELNHTYKNKLISSAFLNVTSDGFSQIPSVNSDTKEQIYTNANYYTLYNYGLSETYIFNTFRWWESHNQVYVYYSKPKFYKKSILRASERKGLGLYLNTRNTFTLYKHLQAEIAFWYHSPHQSLFYKVGKSYSLDLSLKFNTFKKIQIIMYLSDILRSSSPDYETDTNGIKQIYNTNYDSRYFKLGLKYNFGNRKIKLSERDFGNEEEKNRSL